MFFLRDIILTLFKVSYRDILMNYSLLDKAYNHCISKGYRYTEPRERVLKILVNENRPLGAYEILEKLSREVKNPKPQTVYRAIQFWHEEGFIHCIDSLKSYVVCLHGHHVGQTQFLICSYCDFVKELDKATDAAAAYAAANQVGFSITNITIEIKGRCKNCSLNGLNS